MVLKNIQGNMSCQQIPIIFPVDTGCRNANNTFVALTRAMVEVSSKLMALQDYVEQDLVQC